MSGLVLPGGGRATTTFMLPVVLYVTALSSVTASTWGRVAGPLFSCAYPSGVTNHSTKEGALALSPAASYVVGQVNRSEEGSEEDVCPHLGEVARASLARVTELCGAAFLAETSIPGSVEGSEEGSEKGSEEGSVNGGGEGSVEGSH